MTCTRRTFLGFSLASAISITAERILAQGVASHTAKPVARQAPSGRPFNAHFVDVAASAGLTAPTIYGGVESKKYILESTGCGCAFIDYDNDGWMDVFLLSGTRLEGPPAGATNRLYKNNRDGTFRDVSYTSGAGFSEDGKPEAGMSADAADVRNMGLYDLYVSHLDFELNRFYRSNGDGTFVDATISSGLIP